MEGLYSKVVELFNTSELHSKIEFQSVTDTVKFVNTEEGRNVTDVNINGKFIPILCILFRANNSFTCTRHTCPICVSKIITLDEGELGVYRNHETTVWCDRIINLKPHAIKLFINTHSYIIYMGITNISSSPQGPIECEYISSNEITNPAYFANKKIREMHIPLDVGKLVPGYVERLMLTINKWEITNINSNVISLVKK